MSTNESRGPLSKRGFIAAAAIVGIIVLAAIVVMVTSIARGSDSSAAPPTSTPSARSTTSTPDGEASVCGLPGFEATSSLTSAPTNEWQLVGTVAAPNDPKGAGPGVVKDGFRSCYAHTAEGALFASVTYIALASDSRNISMLPNLLAPGKGKDSAIAAATGSPSPTSTRLQVAGFKVNSYSQHEAVIDVAWTVTSSDGALVSLPTVLDWVDGDWKIVLASDGQPPFASSSLQDLGGYIPWSGV
ncbi:MAG: hypothetical protein JWP75_4181 [Frondihabitans sp.]|nr:hypothetical protein [Frondihabitans sp.]